MIFGAKEEIIPKYYDDDKPKSVQKTPFGLVGVVLFWLTLLTMLKFSIFIDEKIYSVNRFLKII